MPACGMLQVPQKVMEKCKIRAGPLEQGDMILGREWGRQECHSGEGVQHSKALCCGQEGGGRDSSKPMQGSTHG